MRRVQHFCFNQNHRVTSTWPLSRIPQRGALFKQSRLRRNLAPRAQNSRALPPEDAAISFSTGYCSASSSGTRDFFPAEGGLQLERVHHRLAAIMVIVHHEELLHLPGHRGDVLGPRRELVAGVEIIVARVAAGVAGEPRLRVAPVKAIVRNRPGREAGRPDRTAGRRLVNVAEIQAGAMEELAALRRIPRGVAHLEHAGEFAERLRQPAEPSRGSARSR